MITVSTLNATKPAYHHGDLRSALVDAGLAVLAEAGEPAALSLREAARRVGVSAMAPYRHFADKEALLAAIAAVGFERLAAAQKASGDAPSPADALKAQGVAYVAFALENPALFRLMFGAGAPSKANLELGAAARASFGHLIAAVANVPSRADQTDRVLGYWSLVHGLAMLALDGHLDRFGAPPLELAARIAALPLEPQDASRDGR